MIKFALLRVVMPGRPVITRQDYKKINLGYFFLDIPQEKIIGYDTNQSSFRSAVGVSTYYEPKYITRPLSDDELLGINLIASHQRLKVYWRPECIIFSAIEFEYKSFERLLETYQEKQQELKKQNFDYDDLEKELDKTKLMLTEGKSLFEVRRQMNRCKGIVQKEIVSHNLCLKYMQRDIAAYLQKTFDIESALAF